MIGLITIGTVFNYLTRAILGVVVAPTIPGDLGMGEQEYSWVTAVFQVGLLLQPVAGYIMDVIGLKRASACLRWHGQCSPRCTVRP